jgi:hypothetical protein
MAGVARSHGIPVEVATFEGWDPAHRMFDVVVCGQAWHWIDPLVGPRKAAAILPPRAWLAIFWNRGRHDAKTQAALDEVYVRFAPSMKKSVPAGNKLPDNAGDIAAIAATRLFEPGQRRTYVWAQEYSRDEWLDQLGTHSDHIALEPQQLSILLGAVGSAIDHQLGGSITVHYDTQLISARRTD